MGCDSKIHHSPLNQNAKILSFGDSLTFGTGAKPEQSYPKILEKITNRQVINKGVPGELSAQAVKRFLTVLEETQPDLIILCHGGNDFLRKLDPKLTKHNLAKMIQMAKSRNIPLVLLAVPEIKLFGSAAPLYSELAKEFGLAIENKIVNKVLRKADLKSDSIHPNAKGYELIADSIKKLLQQTGALN